MIDNMKTIHERLQKIDWGAYHHSFGPAVDTPEHLTNLFSGNLKLVGNALEELENTLCHQGVYISPVMELVFPFLIEALPELSTTELAELLLLFSHMAANTRKYIIRAVYYPFRRLDISWPSILKYKFGPREVREWYPTIRQLLLKNRKIFEAYR